MLSRFDTLPPSSSTSCSYLLYIRRAVASFSEPSWNTELAPRGILLNFNWHWILGRLGESIFSVRVSAFLWELESLAEAVNSHELVGKGVLIFIRISGTFIISFPISPWKNVPTTHSSFWRVSWEVALLLSGRWACCRLAVCVIDQKIGRAVWANGVSTLG